MKRKTSPQVARKRSNISKTFRPRLERLETRTAPAFLPGVPYATGATPTKPDVADFNLDGNLDVAVGTCFISQVSVLLGNGDGTLAPFDEFPNQGTCPYSTETADMNNDGIPDIEMANFQGESITVHLGFADGTFQTPIVTPLPDRVIDLVVRDFNGDGLQDAAAVAYLVHKLYILLGNGNGTLQHIGTLTPGKDPIQVDAGDFNSDGALDLAVANQNISQLGSFSCFLGNGDGTFKPRVDYPTGGIRSQAISVGDFGSDGILDVVVTNSFSNRLSVFKGNGNGTFQPPAFYRVRGFPVGLTVNDFNLDGFNDIAVSCASDPVGSVTLLLNNQSGGFYRHSINQMPQTYWLVSADLNSDGYIDVVASHEAYNKVTVLLNDGIWDPPTPVPQPVRCRDYGNPGGSFARARTSYRRHVADSRVNFCAEVISRSRDSDAGFSSGVKLPRDLLECAHSVLPLAWDVLMPGVGQVFLSGELQ